MGYLNAISSTECPRREISALEILKEEFSPLKVVLSILKAAMCFEVLRILDRLGSYLSTASDWLGGWIVTIALQSHLTRTVALRFWILDLEPSPTDAKTALIVPSGQ